MESYKTMETMEEALDKLGCRQNFGQGPVEPVDGAEPHALLDIASLALYGCHALPVRFKILLDRLFSVLRPDQVVQVLRGFGWTQEDYARGYILNEANGASLDRFNLCSPEEEPLVLQQFLRFGETRALTEQLLRSAAGGKPGHEQHAPQERVPPSREERAEQERTPPSTPAQPAPAPAPAPSTSPSREDDKRMSHALNFSLSARQSQPSAAPVSPKNAPSQHGSQHGPSPGQQSPQSHGLGSFLNRGSLPQPQSPPGGSPLNRLQNMQPFDFRKMAASAVRASPEPPGILNLRPPPPPAVPTSNMSQLPLPFSHSALGSVPLTAANLVASSFPGLISSAMAGAAGNKSPSTDLTSRTGSSDMGSEASDEDDSKGSALNLSRDNDKLWSSKRPASSAPSQHRSSKQPPSSYSPLKRESAWPSSPSQMPVNLGTQLINPATGKKRVQCNVCLKTFCDKGALKIHFSAVHLREMHRCTVEGCSMMFSSRRSRNRHSANPNPKLHSPHLRRKISPHDGRSAQAHPILLPPHQAQLGALNPLSFGGFPLLPPDPRDPRDPRNAAVAAAAAAAGGQSALDLKNSLGLSLKYEREHWERRERQRDRDDGVNMTSLSMDEDDDDDEEGIVVVGGADDDYDGPEDLQAKRPKLSVSDGDDNSNMDMDDDSQSALDLGTGHENGLDHPADLHGREHSEQSARSGRKRKSQNPTRCTQPASMDDLDSSSDGQDGMAGLDLRPKRREDHQDTEERQAREQDSVQPPHEESNSQDDQVFRLTKVQKGDSIRPPSDEPAEDKKPVIKNEPEEARRDEVRDEHRDNPRDEHPNGEPSSPCSPPGSPAGSLAGSQTSSLGSHDEDGFYFPDGYNMDVPIDKDNPRRCPACGKVFQNHFGVKTHFQNVHLKLMHKCTVEGCNAAFPSKRSRDRHSANLNLHRKLLSTSSSGDKPAPLWGGMHPDLLARLYADPGHPGHPGHPVLMPPFGYSPLAFGHPLNNGRAGSTSPTSPRSPRSVDEELLGRPPKLDPFLGPFQAARSRSDPGGLAEGLTSSMTNHSDSLVAPQRRPSASSDS